MFWHKTTYYGRLIFPFPSHQELSQHSWVWINSVKLGLWLQDPLSETIHGYWIWFLSLSVSQLQFNIQLCSGILFQSLKISGQIISAAHLSGAAGDCSSPRSAGLVHGMREALHLACWQLLWRQGPKFTSVLVLLEGLKPSVSRALIIGNSRTLRKSLLPTRIWLWIVPQGN